MSGSDNPTEAELLQKFEHVIESAYQDMQGVLGGRKNYRLRHAELAGHLLTIFNQAKEAWTAEARIDELGKFKVLANPDQTKVIQGRIAELRNQPPTVERPRE